MNWTDAGLDLRFARRPRLLQHRSIPVGIVLFLFTLLWTFVPRPTLYWLLLPLQGILVWMASYGWRQSVAALIGVLRRLEQF